jgi:single-strand DNA-binding protein
MFQSIVICGRVGRDLELKTVGDDKQVVKFPVAVNDGFGHKQRTEWFNCVIWNKKAEIFCNIAQKGALIFLEGKQITNEWTDAEGKKHSRIELHATNFRIVQGGKPKADAPVEEIDEFLF